VKPSPWLPAKLFPVAATTGMFRSLSFLTSSVIRWPTPPSWANQFLA